MVSLFTMYYNFCGPHKTLGRIHTTPAMAAGLTDRVWKLEDLVAIIDGADATARQAGAEAEGGVKVRHYPRADSLAKTGKL